MSEAVLETQRTEEQQRDAWLWAAYRTEEKDEATGVLLAFFLGVFGAHHFYLRRNGLGVAYLLFFWTGIPALVALVECFFMPARVRRYNWEYASLLRASVPPVQPLLPRARCQRCGAAGEVVGRYCGQCGAAIGQSWLLSS